MVAAKKQLPGSRAPCSLQSIEVILGLSLLLVPFTLVLLLLLFPRAVASCGNSILPLRVALAAAAAAVHGSAWSFFHRSASHLRQMPRCILKLGRLCFSSLAWRADPGLVVAGDGRRQPLLWTEVYARALRASKNEKGARMWECSWVCAFACSL